MQPAPSASPQFHLQTLLVDVVKQLDGTQKVEFAAFVQDLKKKRDRGEIPSLADALLQESAAVVGLDVWKRAKAKQLPSSLPTPAPAAPTDGLAPPQ